MKRSQLRRRTPLSRKARPRGAVISRTVDEKIKRKLINAYAGDLLLETKRMLWALSDRLLPPPTARYRRRTKYARRERDYERMHWIKSQPCCLARPVDKLPPEWLGRATVCLGGGQPPTEAHHAGARGVGAKAGDDTCIPLCGAHHHMLTDRTGPFAGWPRGAVKAWELAMIAEYQRRYAERGDAPF